VFFPYWQRPRFVPIQNRRQKYGFHILIFLFLNTQSYLWLCVVC
jgi:hypothetical protein